MSVGYWYQSVGGVGGGIHVQCSEDWMSSHTHRSRLSKRRSVVELTNKTKKFKALKGAELYIWNKPCITWPSHDLLPQAYSESQERCAALQETVSDQEIALVETGKKLSGQGSVMLISVTRSADLSKKTSLTDPLSLCPSFLPQ